jgi:uncharacterized membrane protein
MALARLLRPLPDALAGRPGDSDVLYAHATRFTLARLYLTGFLTSFVLGKKILAALEYWVGRLPSVQGKRVVPIGFPSPKATAVGLVTKVTKDADSGRELAVVCVPTSPSPTSGHIEILPLAGVAMPTGPWRKRWVSSWPAAPMRPTAFVSTIRRTRR